VAIPDALVIGPEPRCMLRYLFLLIRRAWEARASRLANPLFVGISELEQSRE
jgi:hypothetical protein